MVLHALPGAAGGDAHLLVVVAGAAARGERVAQPEAVLVGDAVGGVGQVRRALVGRDHQVRVVAVHAHHFRRVQHARVRQVVGHVQQARDVLAVAVDQVGVERGPRRHVALQHEAALRPDRHDHRVLDHLGLHQAQDLGAEVVVAVAPADAAARDLAAAQVDALQQARVHVDLEHRPRRGHALHLAAVHLDRDDGPLRALEEVRAQRRPHQVRQAAQDLVLGQASARRRARSPPPASALAMAAGAIARGRGIEARGERAVDGSRRPRCCAAARRSRSPRCSGCGSAAGGCAACAAPPPRAS